MSFPAYIELFGATIHPHLLFEALAYLAGMQLFWATRKRWPDSTVRAEQTVWILAGCVLGALVGSKLLAFFEHGADVNALLGGKTIVGGLLGGWIGVEIAKRGMGVRHSTGDAVVAPVLAGMAIGRIGCFLTGLEDRTYGVATSLPWAIDFGDGVARHPTQLYDIAFLSLCGAALLWLHRIRTLPNGALFRLFMAAYLAYRFGVEFLKPRVTLFGVSAIQVACLVGLAVSLHSLAKLVPSPERSLSHG